MPSFDLLHKVEYYLKTGKHQPEATPSAKKVTHNASKKFILKDGCLYRKYRQRLLQAVMSEEEVREIMIRYHDNNNHAGRVRMVKEIMSMYYWVGVSESVRDWIKSCELCKDRKNGKEPHMFRFCLAYGCDASSFLYPELTFHKFPKSGERRKHWLVVAQRDEGSVRPGSFWSYLCSRHFEPECFITTEDGQVMLTDDAVPTIIGVSKEPCLSDEFLHPTSLEDLLSCAAASAEVCSVGLSSEHTDPQLQEHQYSLPTPDPRETPAPLQQSRQPRPTFTTYNLIARYLSHRILPQQGKGFKCSLRRMAKRYTLIDGVLMYNLRSPPLRVPRSREEVTSILQQFHDNRGHYGYGICYKAISSHYHWGTMNRDLHHWISKCSTCVNRSKRKWLRCSVVNCSNCCGPVERGLGLTFHNFPMDSASLLPRWLKAAGRPHWYPHLWSSVCSVHFTEDCFDRSGGKVVLRPDAVPTVKTHGDEAIQNSEILSAAMTEDTNEEEAFFAKYEAVELYISRRTYPQGLTYVEKNTFRRFCKKYFIKDGQLHIRKGERLLLVLRNRQQVNEALKDYHDELNHLDVNKCLRLLNERYFWKTMRPDIVQWISKCLVCRLKQKKKEYPSQRQEPQQEEIIHQQLNTHSGDGDAEVVHDTWDEDVSDDSEAEPVTTVNNTEPQTPAQTTSIQKKIPILLHLKTPINLKPKTPIIVKSAPKSTTVAQMWPPKTRQKQKSTGQSKIEDTEIQIENPHDLNYQHEEQVETSTTKRHVIRIQKVDISHTEVVEATPVTNKKHHTTAQYHTPKPQLPTHSSRGRLLKRKAHPDDLSPTKRVPSAGLEPVVGFNSKPWPVCVVGSRETQAEAAQTNKKSSGHGVVPSSSVVPSPSARSSEARVMVQQCSRAQVKVRNAVEGSEAQYAQIGEGLVVYVCFFEGATEDVTQKIADCVMTTRMFRVGRRLLAVLDLPGSVLVLPQDSLGWELGPRRAMQRGRGASEPWWGAQLFSAVVSRCREHLSQSEACTRAGCTVEQGLYGQRQEIELSSVEPRSHVLEF